MLNSAEQLSFKKDTHLLSKLKKLVDTFKMIEVETDR